MWPKRRKPDALSETLSKLQADLHGKESDPSFLLRLAQSMDKCPEPYEWILLVLKRRLDLLEKQPAITQDSLVGVVVRQAEIRAEVRLLRSLSKMALQAQAALDRERALSQEEFEAAETANS